uniref:UbiA prenyltransferase family protein n=1 Tax=viral metagenome TaxID=1070528 RepID=A0A6C0B3U7_9ZZZZ
MKLLQYIFYPFFFINARSFVISRQAKSKRILKTFEFYDAMSQLERPNKLKGVSKLIRSDNILPALLLNFTGGWLSNPQLVKSKQFIISAVITLFVMSYSMIVNDVFDLEVDRINNPERPLVTGQISRREAIALSIFIVGTTEFLNNRFMPGSMKPLARMALFIVTIYTPILKRICIIKNLTCAGLISFALYYSGLAVNPLILQCEHNLLNIAGQLIFWGSYQNEVLLDILDKDGDEKAGIPTVPVLFGNEVAYTIANFTIHFNILWNLFYQMSRAYRPENGFLLILFCSPLLNGLRQIKNSDFNHAAVRKSVNSTIKPMVLTLLYICFLRSTAK